MTAPTAESIARALGGTRTGGQWLARCPSHEDRKPSLSIRDGRRGVIVNCMAGCGFADVRDAFRSLGLLPPFRPGMKPVPVPRPVPASPSVDELRKRAMARRLYDLSFPCLQSTPCEAYLRSRGIWQPAQRTQMRYARLEHPQSREMGVPAIVIPRNDTRTGALVGIQRVFLSEAGSKYPARRFVNPDGSTGLSAAKISLGIAPTAWAMLHKATDRLVLCEGMETALAASVLFDRPAWARCSGFPAEIVLPEHVRDVLIAADHDKPGTLKNGTPKITSEARAKALAQFIISTGRKCEVYTPEMEGDDCADVLLAEHCEHGSRRVHFAKKKPLRHSGENERGALL